MTKTTIIGIDCATQARKTGLARGHFEGQVVRLEQVTLGTTSEGILETIIGWLEPDTPTLLALDAPLGWPQDLGHVLSTHNAGGPISVPANTLFRRVTDAIVKQEIGKQPLDVGAERIARTAHTALDLLHRISQHTKQPIPLAWQPQLITPLAAIEVYPAATLTAHHINMLGYKKPDGQAVRSTLLSALTEHIILPLELELMIENDNVLDAAVCILAGADFLRGITIPPFDKEVAKKEGWIWVRKPK